ncbi:MAG TPA: hypothetical protein VLQ45_12255 [Thermoanaerobaculia bacterium]|nr:hypothetical protein [Thermoanaerobaculia bacterium]
MSLISDALKKARQEAARQDSLRQGLPYAVGTTNAPDRSRSAPLLAGLAVGLLLAAGLAGLFYFVRPERGVEPEARIAETAPPAVVREEPAAPPVQPVSPSPVPQITEPAVPETAPPAPVPTPIPEVRTPEPAPPREVQPVPQPQLETQPVPPVVAPPAPPVQEPAAPPAAEAPAPRENRSYVGEVPVPGGGVLRLNGIAFSTQSPVAVLDGKVVGPGEVIQGFTVVEIRQNQVKLEGHGETVFVSLK